MVCQCYLFRETAFNFIDLCYQFSSVTQLCLTLCNPMDCSTPSFPVYHQLPELAQTPVHWVSDTIQPSHPVSSPCPPAFDLSHHQGLFQSVSSSNQVVKVLEIQLQHQFFWRTLEVVKQEMARVNINILGIRELNGPEWVLMTIISTTVGKNPLEGME